MAGRGRGARRLAVFLHLLAAAVRSGARSGPSAHELLVFGLGSSDQKVGVRAHAGRGASEAALPWDAWAACLRALFWAHVRQATDATRC